MQAIHGSLNLLHCVCLIRGLELLQVNRRRSLFFKTVDLGEMVMCLEDLINYFAQPEEEMGKVILVTAQIMDEHNKVQLDFI